MSDDKYQSADRRIDTVAGRNAYWMQLRNLKAEYDHLPAEERGIEGSISMGYGGGFYTWTRFKYGIEMLYNEEGNIQGDYNVVDQDLYLLFLLKYPA